MRFFDFMIAVAVGLVDEYLENKKVTIGGKEYSATTVGRPAMFVGGLVLDFFGRGTLKAVGEALEIASTPLLIKTVAKEMTKTGYHQEIVYVPAPAPAPVYSSAVAVTSY